MKSVIIIGGGPVGLYLAHKLEENNLSYLLLEATNLLGGQLVNLYPEKEITDLKDQAPILAKDCINLLVNKVNPSRVLLNEEVITINTKENNVEVITNNNNYLAEYVIIATGLGFYTPQTLALKDEEKYSNILYHIKQYEIFKKKKVVVFGGGNAALDHTKEIAKHTRDLSLVHRRKKFRGNGKTIENIPYLRIKTPYIATSLITEHNKLIGIQIQNLETKENENLEADYIIVNYGSLPHKVSFDVPTSNRGIICDEFRCIKNRLYVAGDAIGNNDKIKRIEDGYRDVDLILKHLFNV